MEVFYIFLLLFSIGVIILIYNVIRLMKKEKQENVDYNITFRKKYTYLGGVPELDAKSGNIGQVVDFQIREKTNNLHLNGAFEYEIDIPIDSIIKMDIKTKEQIINKQLSPSLLKVLTLGVFSIGTGKITNEISMTMYLIVKYKDIKGQDKIFAIITDDGEDIIRKIYKIQDKEYSVNIQNYI